jgi:undecaprenyl diphosphate synthase
VTLYAFSTENWKRPEDEVGRSWVCSLSTLPTKSTTGSERVQIRIIGDTTRLPTAQRMPLTAPMARTSSNDGLKLSIALNYGSRAEILLAANKAAKAASEQGLDEIPQELFESFSLYKRSAGSRSGHSH